VGKKTSLGACVVCVKHPQTLQNNFAQQLGLSFTYFSNPCQNDGNGDGVQAEHEESKRKKCNDGNGDY
jgi:hypothetical protein